jgi:hypothetical protein
MPDGIYIVADFSLSVQRRGQTGPVSMQNHAFLPENGSFLLGRDML